MSWNSEPQVGRAYCDQVAATPEIALELLEIEAGHTLPQPPTVTISPGYCLSCQPGHIVARGEEDAPREAV